MQRNIAPFRQGQIIRPKVDKLLSEAIKFPLVTVTAGPGYGKTQAVASFISRLDVRIAWLRLTKLDNIPARFWNCLANSVGAFNKDFADRILQFGFPENITQFDIFIRLLAREAYNGDQIILVMDDYHHIDNHQVHHFINNLVDMNLENICLILISRSHIALNTLSMIDNNLIYQITKQQLLFTMEEVEGLLKAHDISFTRAGLQEFYDHVEGWPFAVYLLLKHNSQYAYLEDFSQSSSINPTLRLFEQECYAIYHTDIQLLFIKLSFLHAFSLDIIAGIDASLLSPAMEILDNHAFINYHSFSHTYTFHNLFRDFLSPKQILVASQEQQRIFHLAASWFEKQQLFPEAITYYERGGQYQRLFSVISQLPPMRLEKDYADFFLEKLNAIPAQANVPQDKIRFMRAALFLNNAQIDKARRLFEQLRDEYELLEPTDDNRSTLGEIYLMLSDISLTDNNDRFLAYYHRARECLPQGSSRRDYRMLLLDNQSIFFLQHNQPGELERMKHIFLEAFPIASEIMHGSGHGLEHLLCAEASFLTHELTAAKEEAFRSIYKAREYKQYDIICNSYYLLMRICVLTGNFDDALFYLQEMKRCVHENKVTSLFIMCDCAEGWFYEKIGDLNGVPWWIMGDSLTFSKQPPMSMGRARLLLGHCLLRQKRYYELLALLEQLETFYQSRGLWTGLLEMHILRAVCQMKLGERFKAARSLHHAYSLSCHNRIITPFVEFGNNMRTLISLARRSDEYDFTDEWLDLIHQKASTYAKRLSTMATEHRKLSRDQADRVPFLTDREMEVLHCLSQGLTRDEIGAFLSISINTVKSIIKNTYRKLGAVNRADAVHIATVMGLIT